MLSPIFHFFLPDCLYGLLPSPFFLSYWFFVFTFFLNFFLSVPCARLSWLFRQLLSAQKYIVSYRIVTWKNKMVKEFWRDAELQETDFSQGKISVTPFNREQCSRLQQSRWCRYCCIHCNRYSQCFSVDPQNCPSPWSGPHLIHGSLSPYEWPTQTASRSVQPFLQSSRPWPTDRHTQTDRPQTTLLRL